MFDQGTRNRLQKFVGEARTLLSEEFTRQLQQDYGLDPSSGEVSPLESLYHLDAARLETGRLLRDTLEHYQAGNPTGSPRDTLQRIVREQAFTVLNRLCALRMAEAREILLESIGKGYQSPGFQLYARLAGTALGDTGGAYRCYLYSLFDEFAVDLAVLFDRFAPTGRLFPRETALLELLDKLNHPDLETLWAQDETIGWIYQYFNSQEERRQMRAESQAPRNSRELAVRNQFFTPRYVVEFLTDNTLGRIWYEMTEGNTALVHNCRYLVRRPTEIFLAPGEQALGQETDTDAELSQEELLKQPAYIPHRPLKDPRTIRMLDPACGSMHFGLYAFDLYERIFEEAWALEETNTLERPEELQALRTTYANDYEGFRRDIPRLILEFNIHGVDIDPRAAQIAGLSLWLRAQRSWKEQGVKAAERPRIERSNVVCAEPMPGENDLLREFAASLQPPVLGQLVMHIFEKMELAGEAGTLLKIEEEIAGAVEKARQAFVQEIKVGRQGALFAESEQGRFDFSGLGRRTNFWVQAEQRILNALQVYAEQAEGNSRRRMFARDAARGFSFIDLCRKRYDVVLMNPPFGASSKRLQEFLECNGFHNRDLSSDFIMNAARIATDHGMVGAITTRTIFFLKGFLEWRDWLVNNFGGPRCFLDIGFGVLDAAVEASVLTFQVTNEKVFGKYWKALGMHEQLEANGPEILTHCPMFYVYTESFKKIPRHPFAYWMSDKVIKAFATLPSIGDKFSVLSGGNPRDDFRFIRHHVETPLLSFRDFVPYSKGGEFALYYYDVHLELQWRNEGRELKVHSANYRESLGWSPDWRALMMNYEHYFSPAITWPRRTSRLSFRFLPKGCVFGDKSPIITTLDGKLNTLKSLIGYLNTSGFKETLNLMVGSSELAQSFEVGIVKACPFPEIEIEKQAQLVNEIFCKLYLMDSLNESSHAFILFCSSLPVEISVRLTFESLKIQHDQYQQRILELQAELEELSSFALDLGSIEQEWSERDFNVLNIDGVTSGLLSNVLGFIFARWDIRYATASMPAPKVPDPFAPLPACPPGMLQNVQGLPAGPGDLPLEYPLHLTWGGILVDDEGHSEDVVGRVREALAVIWGSRAGDIEQEACDIMGVKVLRDYFRSPGKFFAEHLKRYSKSRRQAPIYWPLGTPSGSYTLWLYYHRLSDQTLYTAVNDFVEPKLRQVDQQSATLRGRSGRSKTEEIELETLTILEQELRELRDELLRVAAFWKPNLNDGVVITAAPLWRLFQHKPWQKTLKETWQSLEKGDYDWAHLAYSIWPERVLRVAQKDRSIAIAHDLEDALWVQVKDEKGKEKWVARELSEEDMQDILKSKNMKMF